MNDTVESLVVRIANESPEDRELVRHNIRFLDAIDPRFSTRALELFTEPGTRGYGYTYAHSLMREWLARFRDIPQATRTANRMNPLAGKDYTEAGIVLYNSVLALSIADMDYLSGYSEQEIFRYSNEGDFYLSRDGMPRPDIFTASRDELNRHFRSTAVAAIILKVERNEVDFASTAQAFSSWVSTWENPDAVLAEAMRLESLDTVTLSAIIGMQQETPSALHSGLI